MKKLVINADDFGISKETNLAIKQGFESGIITSTSLIINLEAYEHAINEILPTIQGIDVGFHFNIIEGKSLTNQPLLCDKNGFFNNSYGQLILKSFNKNFLKQVEITDSSGKTLKRYDFLKCGRISNNQCNPIQYAANYKHLGVKGAADSVIINSYQEAYLDFCKICEQFGLLPSDVIDYDTWITEHFCLAIDLSPYELTPGSDINLNLSYESWNGTYNPFYLNGNQGTNKYLTNQILLQWYGSKALSIGAGEVMLKNVLTKAPESVEVQQD